MSSAGEDPSALDSLPILSGLGPELEHALLDPLEEAGAIVVTRRCVSGDQIGSLAAAGNALAAILSSDLHGLSATTIEHLHLPRVVLVADPGAERWQGIRGLRTLPRDARPDQVGEALILALRGEPMWHTATTLTSGAIEQPSPAGRLIVVTKYRGAPGATSTALGLTALLAGHGGAVLCDLDPAAAAAGFVDADPTRNLYMAACSAPSDAEAWERTLEAELQPLCADSSAMFLAGVPKPEQRPVLAAGLVTRLLNELRQRFGWVVVDVSLDGLVGQESALVRAALNLADTILLVGATDLVGLWHTRQALRLLQGDEARVKLVLNRFDARRHYSVRQIAFELGTDPVAVVPHDYDACAHAIAAQRPVVFDKRSRAKRALGELADPAPNDVGGGNTGRAREPSEESVSLTDKHRFRWTTQWRRTRAADAPVSIAPPQAGARSVALEG